MKNRKKCISIYVNEEEYSEIKEEAGINKKTLGKYIYDIYKEAILDEKIAREENRILFEIKGVINLLKKLYALEKLHIACEKFVNFVDTEDSDILRFFEKEYRRDKYNK